MIIRQAVQCARFPCIDVDHSRYNIPEIDIDPERFSILLISECAPENPQDNYYAAGNPLFEQTTVQAFKDAGVNVSTIQEILSLGVYLTTAVKCAKTSYSIQSPTIKDCSLLLKREIDLFPNIQAYLLMGDTAIKALNTIAQHIEKRRVVPAGSTYKIRNQAYTFRGARVFPSYLQAGPSFFIEKSKRKMIAEDIAAAMQLISS